MPFHSRPFAFRHSIRSAGVGMTRVRTAESEGGMEQSEDPMVWGFLFYSVFLSLFVGVP